MSNFVVVLLFVLGFVLIVKGGDLFVDASVWIAEITGVPKMLIGATIVSLATTLPELLVSVVAASKGVPDMAIGNAIGSTICNIGLILGICCIFMPGKTEKAFKPKGLLMLGATLSLMIFSLDRNVDKIEGIMLLLMLVFYVYINLKAVKAARKATLESAVEVEDLNPSDVANGNTIFIHILKFLLGAIGIVLGARLLVDNGVIIAHILRIPQQIISLTLIAIGTSLPELTTAITSIRKGEQSISIGNILGANILNVTMILGTSSLITKNGLIISSRNINLFGKVFKSVPQTLYIDVPVSIILMLVVIVPGIVSNKLRKRHGIIMISIYSIYLIFLAVSIM
ncbi:calcium/sodium antiporter [Clostridium sediminicola]|uniref:calcium/sodium antiporter n=1 Tax=Clostridium sediminicola TaxID=3114879 RepID=UPI0031F26E74